MYSHSILRFIFWCLYPEPACLFFLSERLETETEVIFSFLFFSFTEVGRGHGDDCAVEQLS